MQNLQLNSTLVYLFKQFADILKEQQTQPDQDVFPDEPPAKPPVERR